MSIAEVQGRIGELQTQLNLLSGVSQSPSATSFAGELSSASNALATGPLGTDALGTDALGTGLPGGGVTGDDLVAGARKYIGIPYVWGGTDPAKGLDCSGLMQRVYKDFGIDLPRVSRDQAKVGEPVPSLAQAKPGDLLAFGSPVHHIGMYIGNNQMIEAPRPGKNVQVSPVYDTPSAIRRVVGTSTAVAATPSVQGALPNREVKGVTVPAAVPIGAASRTLGAPMSGAISGSASVSAATPYASEFVRAGQKHGVDPALLAAVAKAESGYNPRAVSRVGAQGLMQLMPGTAKSLGVANPFDPAQAIDGAARMLRDLTNRFGSTPLALAAYNAGPGAVMKYNGIPPYAETQNYVKKIMTAMGGQLR